MLWFVARTSATKFTASGVDAEMAAGVGERSLVHDASGNSAVNRENPEKSPTGSPADCRERLSVEILDGVRVNLSSSVFLPCRICFLQWLGVSQILRVCIVQMEVRR